MNILIPTDFSDYSKHAINYVYNNFKKESIDIRLIHTIREPHSTSGVLIRLDQLMKQDAINEMEALVSRIEEVYGERPEYFIKYGHLSDWVKQFADSLEIDLIVMGTKGSSNMASKIMGSVTEAMIRTAKVPVLAIPEAENKEPVHIVMIATARESLPNADFIERFEKSLNPANLHLDVLRVVPPNSDDKVPKSVEFRGNKMGMKIVESNSVVEGINTYLKSNRVDILGMFHSHKSRLDYLFNRSVTRSICKDCKVPLLAIPVER